MGRGRGPPDDGSCYTRHLRDLDVPETTFTSPDLTTFLGLDALGLTAVGQLLTSTRAIVECRMPIGFEDPFCRACGAQGQARGTVARRLAHVPVEWGLRALALECMSVSRLAAALGISWHTANNAILTRAEQTIVGNLDRFDGVEVLGVDDSPARFAPVREVPPLCGATPGGATGTSPS